MDRVKSSYKLMAGGKEGSLRNTQSHRGLNPAWSTIQPNAFVEPSNANVFPKLCEILSREPPLPRWPRLGDGSRGIFETTRSKA